MELINGVKPEDQEETKKEIKKPKPILDSVVKRKRGTFARGPCMNLLLQKLPYARLWLTSTVDSDGKEDMYKKDIVIYPTMKVSAKDKELFEIICPVSKKKYQLYTSYAE